MDEKPATQVIRAIEDSFPIVEINRLAVPERNAFKPIYQMHKWFARRASCVFRAILLGCLKPLPLDENGRPTKTGAELIMEEFYRDHTDDPDTNGKSILDPFMGGGTTVVEGLRLGCHVVGIDLNPVAWFIVKTEVEPVNPAALHDALERLAQRAVRWSSKPLREALRDLYRTQCPCCGAADADIMCTFWVKSAICTACGKQVHLFKNYVIAQKSPSIRYFRDASCTRCSKTFDWELEPAALVAEAALQVNSSAYSAGVGRSTVRWAYSPGKTVICPWCSEKVTALPSKAKSERKKVLLAVLLCPFCQAVWQWRGDIPECVGCPVCGKEVSPLVGNLPDKGEFQCACGHRDDIIRSIRRLPEDQLLPMHPYAIEGWCGSCAGGDDDSEESDSNSNGHLFSGQSSPVTHADLPGHDCRTFKNGGRFFARVTPAHLYQIDQAVAIWEREKNNLPHPKQPVPEGYNTDQMLKHNYRFWYQMFHPRQLLGLAAVLDGIRRESDIILQDMLLSTFQALLERNNLFCRYFDDRDTVQGSFARHEYAPKLTIAEASLWGREAWRGTVPNMNARTVAAKRYCLNPYDLTHRNGKSERVPSTEKIYSGSAELLCMDARDIRGEPDFDFLVTDPPYVGNVNYAELSEFFYVWLRLALSSRNPEFAPEQTPWVSEIVENPTRGLTRQDFTDGLTGSFSRAAGRLRPEGLLVFTFHHAENTAWEAVLKAVCDAGFEIIAAYPIHGEKESSSQLMDTEGISYDLIHVCKKRTINVAADSRSWAGIRQEIRRRARAEVAAIETGRYGREPLSPNDVNIVLIGKCLELYSRHYGAVVDHEGQKVPLHEALKQIRDIADQMVEREHPLPSELDDIEPESRVYLRALCRVKEIKSDEFHKATRGVLEPTDLIEAGLITRMRAGRGRSYEVKQPSERLSELLERFGGMTTAVQENLFGEAVSSFGGTLFVDRVHLLLGLAEAGENVLPWLERFRAETPQIRAAMEFIESHSKHLAAACRKVLSLLEVGPLLKGVT